MKWFNKRKYGPGPQYLLLLIMALAVILITLRWLGRSDMAQYEREDSTFHTLSAAPRILVNPEEQVTISDGSIYADDEALALSQYTCYYYNQDMLIAEVDYDREGSLISQSQWEYDAAGNLIREWIESDTDGVWTRRCVYEYDDAGDVVHQKVYWDEKMVEDNYFRHTDIGRAGISYSYLDDRAEGGISQYCSGRMEFVEDEEGKLRCMFHFNTAETEHSKDASRIQWAQKEDYLVSREQFYEYESWYSTRSDWYREMEAADWEQFNLYEYSETKRRNHILQINYEWLHDQEQFELSPSFYRARYDGDLLLWQMEYTDGTLSYYTVCQYDMDGRLQSGVEYRMEEEPHAVFYRFTYPRWDLAERYSYDIQGQEFVQEFGEEERVLFTFTETGILSGIEMKDAAGNVSEKYEFKKAGEDAGSIEKMYMGSDVLTGERAVLEKLEADAEACGFRAGEELEGQVEDSESSTESHKSSQEGSAE